MAFLLSWVPGIVGAVVLFVVYGLLGRRRVCFGCSLRDSCEVDRR